MQYATLAAKQLAELDLEGKATYQSSLAKFLQQMAQLDEVTREAVASIPPENRKPLTYSFPHFACCYCICRVG